MHNIYITKVAKAMIIDGSFDSLNINGSFDMKDENGMQVFNVSRNKYMPNKIYIKSPSSDIEYLGEVIHSLNNEEFALYEEDSEILRIKQTTALGIPKFNITSPFGDFTTKFSLRKRTLVLLDGGKEILTFIGTPQDYRMDIDDNCNTFYVMSIAYGITTLLNSEEM